MYRKISSSNLIFKYVRKFFSQENTKLKKKFYNDVNVLEIINKEYIEEVKDPFFNKKLYDLSTIKNKYYQILLDGKKCKTLFQDELKIPNKRLAYGIAQEFHRQKEDINLYSMHLVKNN